MARIVGRALVILWSAYVCASLDPHQIAREISQDFQFVNPLIICGDPIGTGPFWKSLFRTSSKGIQLPREGLGSLSHLKSSIILCTRSMNFSSFQHMFQLNDNFSLSIGFPSLFIVPSDLLEEVVQNSQLLDLSFRKQLYFVDQERLDVEDIFIHNGVVVRENLGTLGSIRDQGLVPFVKRRQNLQAVPLKVLIEDQNPYVMFHHYETPTQGPFEDFYCLKDSNQAYGMFIDIFHTLSLEMNFTYQFCRRFDGEWGTWRNGTTSGMVANLARNEVDMIATSMTLNPERFQAVSYLFPLGTETYAIYIGNPESETSDWRLYTVPFSVELWGFLLCAAFSLALIIRMVDSLYEINQLQDLEDEPQVRICDIFKLIPTTWMVFGSFFGRKPSQREGKCYEGVQVMIFSILLTGNVVFMSYRASITSELSVWELRLPFSNLWELWHSDFMLITQGGGLIYSFFVNADESNILSDVYERNMKPLGQKAIVTTTKEGLDLILEDQELAFFYSMESILSLKEFDCQVIPAWITDYPGLLAYALPLDSPYNKAMYYKILTLLENGKLAIAKNRWKSILPECSPDRVVSLGFPKIFTLFLMVLLGASLALLIFVIELICAPPIAQMKQDWTGEQKVALRKLQAIIADRRSLSWDPNYLLLELEQTVLELRAGKLGLDR